MRFPEMSRNKRSSMLSHERRRLPGRHGQERRHRRVRPLRRAGDGTEDAACRRPAKLLNALNTANVKLSNAHHSVQTIPSPLGPHMNELDALDTRGATRDLMDKSHLAEMQDLDPASAISEFYQREAALKATQATFARVSSIAMSNDL
jgi:flagellar hook-associated protein 3 FlgL